MTPKASSALILYNHICNFVYGERQGSNFIILYVDFVCGYSSSPSMICWKTSLSLIALSWHSW